MAGDDAQMRGNRRAFRPRWVEDDDPVFLGSLAMWSSLGLLLGVYVATAPAPSVNSLDLTRDYMARLPPPAYVVAPEDDAPASDADTPAPSTPERESEPQDDDAVADAAQIPGPTAEERQIAMESRMRRAGILSTTYDTPWEVGRDHALEMDDLGKVGRPDYVDHDPKYKGPTDPIDGPASIHVARIGPGGTGEGIGGGPHVVVTEQITSEDIPTGEVTGIRNTMRRYQSQVRYCYEQELKRHPELSGRIGLELMLEEGRVADAWTSEATLSHPPLTKCLLERSKRWRFDEALSGQISWPLVFRPGR